MKAVPRFIAIKPVVCEKYPFIRKFIIVSYTRKSFSYDPLEWPSVSVVYSRIVEDETSKVYSYQGVTS